MFKNYPIAIGFKTAWRNLSKNKTFSLINILGLSIGISCFLLIALYVLDELSYDKYNAHAEQIYRINNQIKFGDFSYDGAEVPAIMGPVFKKDFPQIGQYTRLKNYGDFLVKKGTENLTESKGAYTDSTLFDVFTLPMIAGDPNTALQKPHSVVITGSMAKKYFNSTDVIGKTLVINNSNNYTISGVIKDIPQQSHFDFDFFFSTSETDQIRDDSWLNYNFQTYLLIEPGTNVKRLEAQLNNALMANATPQFQSMLNISKEAFSKARNSLHISLMPLTDIHLYSNITDELKITEVFNTHTFFLQLLFSFYLLRASTL